MKKPNLKGLIKADQVKTIGSGNYAQDYVPWSVIQALVNEYCPGWTLVINKTEDGQILHRVGNTGYVSVCYQFEDGSKDVEWIQSVMDNRHKPVAWDKIDSRAVTDTHRRALVACAAATFNLGIELWTRETLDDGYQEVASATPTAPQASSASVPVMAEKSNSDEDSFREFGLKAGLNTQTIDKLVSIIKNQLDGNWQTGINNIENQGAEYLNKKFS
jgi:hypothetical protein